MPGEGGLTAGAGVEDMEGMRRVKFAWHRLDLVGADDPQSSSIIQYHLVGSGALHSTSDFPDSCFKGAVED